MKSLKFRQKKLQSCANASLCPMNSQLLKHHVLGFTRLLLFREKFVVYYVKYITVITQMSSPWLCRYWKVVVSTEGADSKKSTVLVKPFLSFPCSFHNEQTHLNPAAFLLCTAVKWSAKAVF